MTNRIVRAVLIGSVALAGCMQGGAAPVPAAGSAVRVLVYNMHAGKTAKNVDNLDGIAALVKEHNADIVLLQEVDKGTKRSGNVDQPKTLATLTGFNVAFGSALDYDGGKYGVAILSRWPIVKDTLYHLYVDPPQERAGGSHEPRSALHVEIAMPDGRLHVINTHLDASRADSTRLQEIEEVLALAGAVRRAGGRVLLGGDLNSTPESETQHRVRDAGWKDAWAVCDGAGDGFSYPDDVPRKRIDYLYLGPDERCRGAQVIETHASDHRPLLVLLDR